VTKDKLIIYYKQDKCKCVHHFSKNNKDKFH